MCNAMDAPTATIVDHIKPHRGDQNLFWDQTNWQALCRRHMIEINSAKSRGATPEDVRKTVSDSEPQNVKKFVEF
jgi:5-methylcytosine-specific restriction endonuclease McrA